MESGEHSLSINYFFTVDVIPGDESSPRPLRFSALAFVRLLVFNSGIDCAELLFGLKRRVHGLLSSPVLHLT